jgi:hypothetical protein
MTVSAMGEFAEDLGFVTIVAECPDLNSCEPFFDRQNEEGGAGETLITIDAFGKIVFSDWAVYGNRLIRPPFKLLRTKPR